MQFDGWGVAHEHNPNSHHMTQMHHPLVRAASVADLEAYPWPDFEHLDFSYLKPAVAAIHARKLAVFVGRKRRSGKRPGIRRMDSLFVDMATDDPMGPFLLDKITDLACLRGEVRRGGRGHSGLGDDIGMQSTIMMSVDMYRNWLKPRLAKVIAAAKAIKPDILISYHSCGYVLPLIDDLIEVGVDILNPVQPECMDFAEVYAKYGTRLSFSGTLGTQKLMPFGTPEQIKAEVRRNLQIAGPRGGLFVVPRTCWNPRCRGRISRPMSRRCENSILFANERAVLCD